MGLTDKIKHGAQEAMGKAKERAGKAKGDDKLADEGKGDQSKANVEQAGDQVKDVFDK